MAFKVGFWKTHEAEECLAHIDLEWDEAEKKAVLAYIYYAMPCAHYRGWANCRICGKNLGSSDMLTHDGRWRFPEQFEHYIIEHGLRPPSKPFIRDAVGWYRAHLKKKSKDERRTELLEKSVIKRYGRG
jgi:hypothetical protein